MTDAVPSPSPGRAAAWRTYFRWAGGVGLAFFAVYPGCNWLTARRGEHHALYLDAELDIPLVPEFVWAYLSMYLLFLLPPLFLGVSALRALGRRLVGATLAAGLVFLLLPARLGFARQVPDAAPYRDIFQHLFQVDLPHNLVPSLHVVFSALILFALLEAARRPLARGLWWGWLALICAATLLVRQHHLLDVATGLALAGLFQRYLPTLPDKELP